VLQAIQDHAVADEVVRDVGREVDAVARLSDVVAAQVQVNGAARADVASAVVTGHLTDAAAAEGAGVNSNASSPSSSSSASSIVARACTPACLVSGKKSACFEVKKVWNKKKTFLSYCCDDKINKT